VLRRVSKVLPSDLAYRRTEPSISFFFLFSLPPASHTLPRPCCPPCPRPLTLHALSSVRGISECFRALYHLDAAPASVHHTVISAYLGCYLPSIEAVVTVHVGSQCKSMQDVVAAKQGRDQACQSTVTSPFVFSHSIIPGTRKPSPSPALAWHKDELATTTSQFPLRCHFTNTRPHTFHYSLLSIQSIAHMTARSDIYPDTLPSCHTCTCLRLVIIFHLGLQTFRHRLDKHLGK
jgi:hypothetical protein